MALTDKLTAIANAIRAKTGKTKEITPAQMADEIASIVTGNAVEPFVEEIYDDDGDLCRVKLVGHTKIRDNAFYNCETLFLSELPAGITSIGVSAFRGCTRVTPHKLPAGVISIGDYAFYQCVNISLMEIPAGVVSIGDYAFYQCTSLRRVTFMGTPTDIGRNTFGGCSNLTTINVPWAEGAVANAPWGATNATINYNYVDPEA